MALSGGTWINSVSVTVMPKRVLNRELISVMPEKRAKAIRSLLFTNMASILATIE